MDHTTLLGLLLAADPPQAACSFRTVFAAGKSGETGTLRYLATDQWILDVDHGGRTVHLCTDCGAPRLRTVLSEPELKEMERILDEV
ncbi:hypothetical protein ACIGFK_02785 [Streptomyces sp. NPDC085524]|uniref:hypothetical protein n=1 Tax=Streptomyces sp. NPDC085524 TaxID=3365728 RepID=UPI0037D1A9D1